MIGLLIYPGLMTGIILPLVLEVNLSFQRKWKVHLKHSYKPRPVIFFVIFSETVCENEFFHMSSVLGYSSISKNPLSLEFYGFSRCHPIHCHNRFEHLTKPRPVTFSYYFAKMFVQTKCIDMTSVQGYSSVSKNPLSLNFY